jgi:DNA-binding transcriptional regulator YiaG
MTCEICNTKIAERMATPEAPYHYTMSGLKDIYLSGITIRRCIQCATESPVIPHIVQLHKVISESLADKPQPLRGDELRFLRKYAGFSSKRFAALLGISASHLSRFENGSYKTLGGSTDKLARAISMSATNEKYMQKVLMQVADDQIQKQKAVRKNRPVFRLFRNRWNKAA